MRNGKLDRSVVLPPAPIEPNYSPDGLTEADIDALIAEVDTDAPARPRPGWLSTDPTETRRARRTARQTFRALTGNYTAVTRALLLDTNIAGPDESEAA